MTHRSLQLLVGVVVMQVTTTVAANGRRRNLNVQLRRLLGHYFARQQSRWFMDRFRCRRHFTAARRHHLVQRRLVPTLLGCVLRRRRLGSHRSGWRWSVQLSIIVTVVLLVLHEEVVLVYILMVMTC